MTEPSVYAQEVSKLKDADELKQACIGLKDTNRYVVFMARNPHHFGNPHTEPSVCGLNPRVETISQKFGNTFDWSCCFFIFTTFHTVNTN